MNDTANRHDDYLPARRSAVPPLGPPVEPPVDDYADPNPGGPAAPAKGASVRLAWHALRRHWAWAVPVWFVVSSVLVYFAYTRIKPTFDGIAQLQVENTDFRLFDKGSTAPVDFAQFMENQVQLLSSPTVIKLALEKNPRLTGLNMLRNSSDPEDDIRRGMAVIVVPKTSLIQVQMSSQEPGDAAEIVNGVVQAFIEFSKNALNQSTTKQIEKLESTRNAQRIRIEKERDELTDQMKKNKDGVVNDLKKRGDNVTVEAYRQLSEELTRVEIAAITAKAKLDMLRSQKALPARPLDDKSMEDAVADEFYADPVVAALQAQREEAVTRLDKVTRLARNPGDPSRAQAEAKKHALDEKIDKLWAKLSEKLKARLAAGPVDGSVDRSIGEAEIALAAVKTQEEALRDKLDKVKVQARDNENDTTKLEFLHRDLERDESVLDKIDSVLKQLKYEAASPVAKIESLFPAKTSNRPDSGKRTQAMAAAPMAVGVLLMGLLVLMELRGGRVSDPDELASRMNLQVLGVVPPLPQIRTGSGPVNGALATAGDLRAQRQLDEFVQSLDHLRVALCARRDQWGRDRHCVLITSACGSEGKTTLAAQLAERCVNAGLMTLLIDADLRNPTLSRMLDASENPGLINVLRGEMTAEDVVMVIGDAGGFHLLPAGTPKMDPSRLLASDRLGKLLAQARESFDMIIVDVPPVLPVPDALTIGRWTDGAVLAVRYDTSRFPLVQRAHRRLAHVGVPVIGVVLNGVRSMDTGYGGYSYGGYGTTYGAPPEDSPNGHVTAPPS